MQWLVPWFSVLQIYELDSHKPVSSFRPVRQLRILCRLVVVSHSMGIKQSIPVETIAKGPPLPAHLTGLLSNIGHGVKSKNFFRDLNYPSLKNFNDIQLPIESTPNIKTRVIFYSKC